MCNKISSLLSIVCGCVIGLLSVLFIAYLVTIGWYSGNDGLNTDIVIFLSILLGGISGLILWRKWKFKALISLLLTPIVLISFFLLVVLFPYVD